MKILNKLHRRTVKVLSFIGWLYKHRKEKGNIAYTTNLNMKERILESESYEILYEKSRNLIDDGITPEESPSHCDNVWICWLQGIDNAPPIVKSCVESIRRGFAGRNIIILSDENLDEYITFPDYIIEKRKKGIITNAHFSDLIRIELLCKYGGIWCDATLLCTQTPPAVMTESKTFVFKDIDLLRMDIEPTVCSSWYMSAWSNQKILLLTRKLLMDYWEEADTLCQYYLFHLFLAMASRRYPEEWATIPVYNNRSPHTLQFELNNQFSEERWKQITAMSPLHKLNHHNTYSMEGTFYSFILSEYGRPDD